MVLNRALYEDYVALAIVPFLERIVTSLIFLASMQHSLSFGHASAEVAPFSRSTTLSVTLCCRIWLHHFSQDDKRVFPGCPRLYNNYIEFGAALEQPYVCKSVSMEARTCLRMFVSVHGCTDVCMYE